MGSIEVSATIDRPVDEVFGVVSHIENNAERRRQADLDTLKEMMEARL